MYGKSKQFFNTAIQQKSKFSKLLNFDFGEIQF